MSEIIPANGCSKCTSRWITPLLRGEGKYIFWMALGGMLGYVPAFLRVSNIVADLMCKILAMGESEAAGVSAGLCIWLIIIGSVIFSCVLAAMSTVYAYKKISGNKTFFNPQLAYPTSKAFLIGVCSVLADPLFVRCMPIVALFAKFLVRDNEKEQESELK